MARGERPHRREGRGAWHAPHGSGGARGDRRQRSRRATDTAYGRPFFHRWPYQKWHGRPATFGYPWPYGARRAFHPREDRGARDERRPTGFAEDDDWLRGEGSRARGARGRDVARYDEGYAGPPGRRYPGGGRGAGERGFRGGGRAGERGPGARCGYGGYRPDHRR